MRYALCDTAKFWENIGDGSFLTDMVGYMDSACYKTAKTCRQFYMEHSWRSEVIQSSTVSFSQHSPFETFLAGSLLSRMRINFALRCHP